MKDGLIKNKNIFLFSKLEKTHKKNVEKDNFELVCMKKVLKIYTVYLLIEKAENNFENMKTSV